MLDDNTFEKYCEMYYNDIFRFCLSKLHSIEDAYDATQETFLFFKTKSFDLMDINVKAWLLWVAHYRVQNIYNKRKKENKLLHEYREDAEPIDRHIESIEMQIVESNIIKYANDIYDSLSDSDKKLYKMLYVDDLSEKHIAEKLNIEPHALYMRVSRLKKRVITFITDKLLY